MSVEGRRFRQAWIDGVRKHMEGEPKPGYVAPWEEMGLWEQLSATAVYQQIADFIKTSEVATAKLSREERGRFVSICWNGQVLRFFEDPKPSYRAPWEDLPKWQQETNCDIFDAIEEQVTKS
ncbi:MULTISPECIES: hypothetical protein [Glycomyces]|uniref:Uncharacterized protein n=2 Tax=Glycomyces TaxID=58113 RepID=A0A9X3PMM2_9ACTN|nr:hypothetical protein [Glycomyces lechevalierae]MDA1386358.1 hypothetical protein [Glycomyces lechevalierae]MDR7338874.1 hypothetical protein [Glycomyces lechevalierae]